MKNIHVLPADKPSNGYILGKCIKELSDVKIGQLVKTYYLMFDEEYFKPQNIYITSGAEDINENDYIISKDGRLVQVSYLLSKDLEDASKVILTTDQDLIKDDIQAIDDEFLEWFVSKANDSGKPIDIVEVKQIFGIGRVYTAYEIIIPKEEPKQETLEEVAEKYSEEFFNRDEISMRNSKVSYIAGAKWQAKQDKQEVQDLKSRLDFVHESSAKAIELIEALQLQTEGMYNEDTIRQVLSKLTLVNPVDLRMTSNGHGEFPDGYKLTEKGIDCIVEQLKK
jgi:hypothetical protein